MYSHPFAQRKQDGYYGFIKNGVNVKTHYSIEYTFDQKVFDRMDKANFEFSELESREFDYLEGAIRFWLTKYFNPKCLHCMLFEEVILDNETILEQCKDMATHGLDSVVMPDYIRDKEKRLDVAKECYDLALTENAKLKNYLKKYHVDIEKVLREEVA